MAQTSRGNLGGGSESWRKPAAPSLAVAVAFLAVLGLTTFETGQVLLFGDTPMAAFVPGVAALLLLVPALRGGTSRETMLWLVALWHELSPVSLWGVEPRG